MRVMMVNIKHAWKLKWDYSGDVDLYTSKLIGKITIENYDKED
jgi:hypothetical protein